MGRELFGTDGVRGIAGEYPLDEDGSFRIGKAVGMQFAQSGQKVVIGRDPRQSSEVIASNVIKGLNYVGVDVVSVGVIPTPGVALITREHDEFVAGIMITASHNPYQYNGVKVFDNNGDKLSDDIEAKLNALIESEVNQRGNGESYENSEFIKKYEDFLVNSAGEIRLEGLKIIIDSANGAASGISKNIFERLGAKVEAIFNEPNGTNINQGCGATDVNVLQKKVVEGNYDLGIALDGDADRIIMVDSSGREVKGDYIMYILAVERQLNGVVATIMSNLGFQNALEKLDIDLIRTKVGDRYVLEGLNKSGYKLGGEQSGHIIFTDLLKTGDALLAAIQTVCSVKRSGKSLANWCDEVNLLPQSIVNIPVKDKTLMDRPSVIEFLNLKTKELADKGRVFIRASGTEPLVRVMVESDDAEKLANSISKELEAILETEAVK